MGQGQSNSPARPGQPAQVKPQTAEEKKIAKKMRSKKLAENRTSAVIEKIRLLGNLGSPNYALSKEQKAEIVHAITDANARLETRLSESYSDTKERWHFSS